MFARSVRVALRLVTLVLALSAVVFILMGGVWYMWQTARQSAPPFKLELTVGNIEDVIGLGANELEHASLGYYLRSRQEEVAKPADPADSRELTFVVEDGENAATVAYKLQDHGLVTDPELFRRVVQYWEADQDIQVGVYSLRRNMTMEEIMAQLQHGKLPEARVAIIEGWRVEQVAEALEQAGVVSANEFLAAAAAPQSGYSFLSDRPAGAPASPEGFLFPDTYQFPKPARADQVIEILLRAFERRVPRELRETAADQGMSMYEVVTLASIVEREAVVAVERPLIAGVYLNRIQAGMYLQSDPTVQYAKGHDPATGGWWNPMVQEEAITVISPYNTFLNPGLPPGPICSPGLGSVEAVLSPTPSDYLFFYSKGDGSHAFAVTYEEHLKNEETYGGR